MSKGLNITLPHKKRAALIDGEISNEARFINAVNTITNDKNKIYLHSTDGVGFISDLHKDKNFNLKGTNILFIGAGAAAESILYRVAKEKTSHISIMNRTEENAERLIRKFSNFTSIDNANNFESDYDLIIKNGTLVDGTGKKPETADIAIKNGLIAAIGTVNGKANQEIDATNLIVTPGFVDIHTHYDGQAIWDSQLKPSSIHGVTTVVMGNCGVGFAPCKPEDRVKLVELMEGVEDIPAPVMHEGLDWQWETFEEYILALEKNQLDIDVCALLPHAALRVYVMGERAIRHEVANVNDMERMRKLAKEAVEAGAFGFSTSRTISHKSLKGEFTPTLRAHEDELTAIAMGLSDAGSGFMEIVSDWNEPDPETEFEVLKRIVKKSGRPVVFSCTQRHDRPHFWEDLMSMARQAQNEGLPIRPVVTPRPIGLLLGLNGSQNPFSGTDTYKSIADLPLPLRVNEMKKENVKKKILSEDPIKGSTFPLINRIGYSQMYRFGSPPNYNPKPEESIEALSLIHI